MACIHFFWRSVESFKSRGISSPTKLVRHCAAHCAFAPLKCACLVGVRVRKFHRHVGAELLLLGVGTLADRRKAHRDCQGVVPQAACGRGEAHARGVVPPEQELAAVRCAGCGMIRRRGRLDPPRRKGATPWGTLPIELLGLGTSASAAPVLSARIIDKLRRFRQARGLGG